MATGKLKVNFSRNEADSTARQQFEALPTGEYHCNIVSVKLQEVKPGSPNAGKPFWNIRFVVQDGKYQDASLFSNVMLFTGKDGTLGMLAQLMKALGFEIEADVDFEVPLEEELEGRSLTVVGYKQAAKRDPKTGEVERPERFNVSGFKEWNAGAPRKTTGDTSLLP